MPCGNSVELTTKQVKPKQKKVDKVFKKKSVVSQETSEKEKAKKLFGM